MSKVTIIGAGNMARGIGTRAVAGGSGVQILDRDEAAAAALAKDLGEATSGGLDTPLTGDLVVLALPYDAVAPVVKQFGEALAGKTIIDVTNPVDFATFAGLVTPIDSSAAQEIAKIAPTSAHVVKAFNTTFAGTLVDGEIDGQQLDVFIAGDDADAKSAVSSFLSDAALRPIDVGDLSRAHYLEGLGFLHISLQMSRGTNWNTGIKLIGG